MSPVRFRTYGVNGAQFITIVAERITHWHQIDYNGVYGTVIYLDTGAEIKVGAWPDDVEKMIRAGGGHE